MFSSFMKQEKGGGKAGGMWKEIKGEKLDRKTLYRGLN